MSSRRAHTWLFMVLAPMLVPRSDIGAMSASVGKLVDLVGAGQAGRDQVGKVEKAGRDFKEAIEDGAAAVVTPPEDSNSSTSCLVPPLFMLKTPVYRTIEDNDTVIDIGCPSGALLNPSWSADQINASYILLDRTHRNVSRPVRVFAWNQSFRKGDPPQFQRPPQQQQVRGTQQRLFFICHGFTGNPQKNQWIQKMANAHLDREDLPQNTQVLVVDWSKAAQASNVIPGAPNYVQAVANVETLGRVTAEFIWRLASANNISLERSLHLLGHSLGAHAMGEAGRWLGEKYHQRPARVSGMDPADPLYWNMKRSLLDLHSGRFVEVVHTSSARFPLGIVSGALGIHETLGDVDMYPNRGVIRQPGCGTGLNDLACSHGRANEFYTAMLSGCWRNGCDIRARRCADADAATDKEKCSDSSSEKKGSGSNSAPDIERLCEFLDKRAEQRLNETDEQRNGDNDGLTTRRKSQRTVVSFETDDEKVRLICGNGGGASNGTSRNV